MSQAAQSREDRARAPRDLVEILMRTTALDCEIRGGEYVAYDRADYKTALRVWLETAEAGAGGILRPALRNPSASRWALAWSSFRRSTLFSSA